MRPTVLYLTLDDQHNFWSRVDRRGPDDCWLWTGAHNPKGYGIIRVQGFNYQATKISLHIHNRPLPKGLCALHKCDNPPCVNPNHLFIGTKRDNIKDAYDKGRRPRIDVGYLNKGSLNGMSILNESKVKEIKQLILKGHTNREIGDIFNVEPSVIWHVKVGNSWKYV